MLKKLRLLQYFLLVWELLTLTKLKLMGATKIPISMTAEISIHLRSVANII